MAETKKTKDEELKESSNLLRGTIKEDLENGLSFFDPNNAKLLKFHGTYQQDDRDLRKDLVAEKKEKAYSSMIRTKLPGGKLTTKQYLGLDSISDKYANGTLRITTRQCIQFHGVVKGDLKKTMNAINKELITTYGACGDVVRNVMASPICDIDPNYSIDLIKIANEISDHFLPASKGYFEIWVEDGNGDKVKVSEEEPIYGKSYLPRKFKIGIMLPEDNCVDIFTQDLGVVVVQNTDGYNILGYNLLIGGGLGHTHNKPETYPRLGSELCFVHKERLLEVSEEIVKVQRDHGGRENRKHARLKYLIDDKGISWFKKELEERLGYKLAEPKPIKKYVYKDHMGWHKQKDGRLYLGIFIESGRIKDNENRKTKKGLKEIIKKFKPEIRLTPQQNIVLCNIEKDDKKAIDEILHKYGFHIVGENLSTLRRNSIACVSLPTCGLAMAEAERKLPSVIDELEEMGCGDEEISIRVSGCPNSCSRAPNSEIGLIGQSADMYAIYVGGDYHGTRLNKMIKEKVKGADLAKEIGSLIKSYKEKRKENERFGDFYSRVNG